MALIHFESFAFRPYYTLIEGHFSDLKQLVEQHFQCQIRFEKSHSDFHRNAIFSTMPFTRSPLTPLYVGKHLVYRVIHNGKWLGSILIQESHPLDPELTRDLFMTIDHQMNSLLNQKDIASSQPDKPSTTALSDADYNYNLIGVVGETPLDIKKIVYDLHSLSPRISFVSLDDLSLSKAQDYRELLEIRDCSFFIPDIQTTNHALQSAISGLANIAFLGSGIRIYVGMPRKINELKPPIIDPRLNNILSQQHIDLSREQFLRSMNAISQLKLPELDQELTLIKRLIKATQHLSLIH